MIPGPKTSCTLQSRTDTPSGTGTAITWTTVCTFDAAFAPLSAHEQAILNKDTVIATHRVMVDYSTIGSTDAAYMYEKSKIVIDSMSYDIISVMDFDGGSLGRHYEIVLKRVV